MMAELHIDVFKVSSDTPPRLVGDPIKTEPIGDDIVVDIAFKGKTICKDFNPVDVTTLEDSGNRNKVYICLRPPSCCKDWADCTEKVIISAAPTIHFEPKDA